MAYSGYGCVCLPAPWFGHDLDKRGIGAIASALFGRVGQSVGDFGYDIGCDTIRAADLDDVQSWPCWKLEYTNDADPDPGQLCLVCKPGREIGYRRLEYLGGVSGHGMFAGMSSGYGHLLRGEGEERKAGRGRKRGEYLPINLSSGREDELTPSV